jgi:hypothetical protein
VLDWFYGPQAVGECVRKPSPILSPVAAFTFKAGHFTGLFAPQRASGWLGNCRGNRATRPPDSKPPEDEASFLRPTLQARSSVP